MSDEKQTPQLKFNSPDFTDDLERDSFRRLGPLPENFGKKISPDERATDWNFCEAELINIGYDEGDIKFQKAMNLFFTEFFDVKDAAA